MDLKYFNQPLYHMTRLILPSHQVPSTLLMFIVVVQSSSGKIFSLNLSSADRLVLRGGEK